MPKKSLRRSRRRSRGIAIAVDTGVQTPSDSPYSPKDYDSNDGMLTAVWGPGMWHFLHTMSFNYPVSPSGDDRKRYSDFIYSLRSVLPCGKCRKNLTRTLGQFPLKAEHMKSRAAFSKYVYDLHEKVNTMLNKVSGLSYSDVRERYEHFRARCAKANANATMTRRIKATAKATDKATDKATAKAEAKAEAKDKGCTEPLYGEKSKCVLKIVPQTTKCDTLQIDQKCVKRKLIGGDGMLLESRAESSD